MFRHIGYIAWHEIRTKYGGNGQLIFCARAESTGSDNRGRTVSISKQDIQIIR